MILKKYITGLCLPFFFIFYACNTTPTEEKVVIENETDIQATTTTNEEQTPFSVTGTELCSDFAENEENALSKYNNNVIDLTGKVTMVNKSKKQNCVFFQLDCSNSKANPTSNLIIEYCPDNSNSLAAAIDAGKDITIRGVFKGKTQDTIHLHEVEINTNPIMD